MVLQSKIDRTSFVLSSYTTSLCIACIRQMSLQRKQKLRFSFSLLFHFPHCFRENNTWLFIPCFTVWFVFQRPRINSLGMFKVVLLFNYQCLLLRLFSFSSETACLVYHLSLFLSRLFFNLFRKLFDIFRCCFLQRVI